MAPNGGPSMTSQARAAELNAAAAARARILNGYRDGELPDIPTRTYTSLTGTRSTPSQFHSSQTNNTEQDAVESFRRPNRPVDRYYPPVATTSAPITAYAYPQSQYADPRAIPAVYAPTHYPAAEYYQPVYQAMQGYPQMYPSYMSGYPPSVSPLHRGAIAAMTRQSTSRSTTASPTKPGPPQHVQVPATPPAKPPRFPSPAKSLSRGPSRSPSKSPSKSPVKRVRATPSPKTPPVEVLRYFTPDDLSPPKIEVEIMRFKAAQENVPKDEDKASPEKSPTKSNHKHEVDNGHHKGEDTEVDEDDEITPRAKQSGECITPKSVYITALSKKTSM